MLTLLLLVFESLNLALLHVSGSGLRQRIFRLEGKKHPNLQFEEFVDSREGPLTHAVEVFERKENLGSPQLGVVLGKRSRSGQVREELATVDKIHDEAQTPVRLECIVQLDDEGVINNFKYPALRDGLFDGALLPSYTILVESLQRINRSRILLADLKYHAETLRRHRHV